jgi:hypothetical protein
LELAWLRRVLWELLRGLGRISGLGSYSLGIALCLRGVERSLGRQLKGCLCLDWWLDDLGGGPGRLVESEGLLGLGWWLSRCLDSRWGRS